MEELKHAFLREMDDHLIRDIGDSLENYLSIADNIIEVIMQTREEQGLKAGIPLKTVAVKSPDEKVRDALDKLKMPFLNKVNAKELLVIQPGREWQGLKLELVLDRDIIHKAYKAQASKVEGLLRYQSPWKIKDSIEKGGEYTIGVEGYPVKITAEMLEFKLSTPENVVEKEFEGGMIYLDKELSEEMKAEGLAGELIEHIMGMRKELNISDQDYIETQIFVDDKTAEQLEKFKEHITSKTHSYAVEFPFDNIFEGGASGYYAVEKEIDGTTAWIGIVVVELAEG
jgi:isoleucyl-tRNA synthetase